MSESDEIRQADVRWIQAQEEQGWKLPFKRPWPLRLPIIRHVRAGLLGLAHALGSVGIGFGTPSNYDCWVHYAVRRGWA